MKSRLEDCHVIVLAVKTVSTKVVGGRLASMLPSDSATTIVSFQNGTHNAEWLQECFSQHPKVQIATSVVAFAAEWETNSATFHLNVSGGCTMEHLQESPARQRMEILVQALNKGKLSSRLCRDIAPMKYAKLVLNLINPINALSGVTVPIMLSQRGYRRVVAEAIREAIGVLKTSSGVPTGGSISLLLVLTMFGWVVPVLLLSLPDWMFVAMLNGNNYKSSMLQDLERGRSSSQTEIDDLCGEIVRLAESEECVPINMALVRLMSKAKKGTCLSPKDLLQQVGLEA
jgi:2-dehydropantoate 2-reductase